MADLQLLSIRGDPLDTRSVGYRFSHVRRVKNLVHKTTQENLAAP